MGGTYAENNTLEVEVTDCNQQTANHVMWHYANWRLWGKGEDLLAWRGLAGYHNKEDIIQERCRLGGRISGNANLESGHIQELGKTFGTQAMSEGGWLYERRSEFASLGGKRIWELGVGLAALDHSEKGRRLYAEGKGLAAISPERRTEINKQAGSKSGQLHKQNGTGVCGIPPEEHSKRASSTNKQRWGCDLCPFESNARGVNRHLHDYHQVDKSHKHKV
jgi:hypothetical protein